MTFWRIFDVAGSSMPDVLVLGAGLTGLAAAWRLGARATVLERAARAGGLVRTEWVGEYGFDHVIHLLHLRDPEVERAIHGLLGEAMVPCPAVAWVETSAGNARFPLQMHLGTLDGEVALAALNDLARLAYGPSPTSGTSYRDYLIASFGETLFSLFFEPYNLKMWRRPLQEMVPQGMTWNLHRPDFPAALAGALRPHEPQAAYNARAWYPRPRAGGVRGMEHLSARMAEQAADLRLSRDVIAVNPSRREVIARGPAGEERYSYESALLSTLPLPDLVARVVDFPPSLGAHVASLKRNAVLTLGLAVRGPRPVLGHWRYYPDPTLVFTRLVFLHEFDPALAPTEGWPLLVEIPVRGEDPNPDLPALLARAISEARAVGALEGEVVGHVWVRADPAYVVFEAGQDEIVAEAIAALGERGVSSLGRYGRWEYSSMEGAILDGWRWAAALGEGQ